MSPTTSKAPRHESQRCFCVPQVSLETDPRDEWTYCVYHPDASLGMGGATLALLLVGQLVAAVASRCFCCGAALRPGGARGCALMLFLSSCVLQTSMMAS